MKIQDNTKEKEGKESSCFKRLCARQDRKNSIDYLQTSLFTRISLNLMHMQAENFSPNQFVLNQKFRWSGGVNSYTDCGAYFGMD